MVLKPPKNLSREAKRLWLSITSDYEIDDSAGLSILKVALEAFDRMRAAQAAIERDGLVLRDRYNQLRNHPAATIERDARSGFLLGMKALRLDIEPLSRPGGQLKFATVRGKK